MTPKLSRVVTQDEGTTSTKSRGHVANKKRYISTFKRPMAPKLSRVVFRMRGANPQRHVEPRSCGHVTN